jgi:hypothetical protein
LVLSQARGTNLVRAFVLLGRRCSCRSAGLRDRSGRYCSCSMTWCRVSCLCRYGEEGRGDRSEDADVWQSEVRSSEEGRGSKSKEETHLDDTPRDVSRSIRFFTSSGSCVDFVDAGSSSKSAEAGVESACTVLLLSSPEYSASRKTPSSDMSSSEEVCWLTSDLYAEGIVHELSMSVSMSGAGAKWKLFRSCVRF